MKVGGGSGEDGGGDVEDVRPGGGSGLGEPVAGSAGVRKGKTLVADTEGVALVVALPDDTEEVAFV